MKVPDHRLLDNEPKHSGILNSLWDHQLQDGFISDAAMKKLADYYDISLIELEGVVSFYHFFHRIPAGKYIIYLDDSIIARFKGFDRVLAAFQRETGAQINSVDNTGTFGLFLTPCIGLSDQAPAALINFHPFTHLNTMKVREIIGRLKAGEDPATFCDTPALNIRKVQGFTQPLFFGAYERGAAIHKLVNLTSDEVISQMQETRLSGRGGAFFPTWIKWKACKEQTVSTKWIICNADEGEPGTFKDRVLMQQYPGLLLEGMICAAYAVGAQNGIIYLRGEYRWLLPVLEKTMVEFSENGLLGQSICGISGFNFSVRIQCGAGSYVCGEETALLESLEGNRGEPRTKWNFPTEKGYLQQPSIINNVETFCAAARIIELGVNNYNAVGMPHAPGTKLITVSGDCDMPGVYEIPWGYKIEQLLRDCNAVDPYYIQLSGPSGECIAMDKADWKFSMQQNNDAKELRCGGAFMVFNSHREIIKILENFSEFFKKESCGICTPCRAGNFMINRKLEKFANHLAHPTDIKELHQWAVLMQHTSRCGLGKSACNSVISAMKNFHPYFNDLLDKAFDGLNMQFDMEKATSEFEQYNPDR